MRGLLAVGSVLVVIGLGAGPAGAAQTVPAKIKFQGVSDFGKAGGGAIVMGSVSSKAKACKSSRRLTLFDSDSKRKLGTARVSMGYWSVQTRAIEVGDRLFAKLAAVKASENGKKVTCAAARSKAYTVKKLETGGQG